MTNEKAASLRPGREIFFTDQPKPKPAHLDPQYASVFKDSSVSSAYAARPSCGHDQWGKTRLDVKGPLAAAHDRFGRAVRQ